MNGNELLDKMGLIDPAYIEAADAPNAKKYTALKRWCAVAACLVLLLSLGFGTYAYAVEAKEYNTALDFFKEYDLPTEGLTRIEIKKIYWDITTKSFTYSKTAQVIISSLSTEQIGGYEIFQKEPTPETVEKMWEYKNENGWFPPFKTEPISSIRYNEYFENRTNSEGYLEFDKSIVEKYDGDTLVWSISFTDFLVWGHQAVSNGVIVYGKTPEVHPSESRLYQWIAKFDEDGNRLWMVENVPIGRINTILENADGSYAVFTWDGLVQYTADGEEISFQKGCGVGPSFKKAVHFGDGYLIVYGKSYLLRTDRQGNVIGDFAYSTEDAVYSFNDVIEYGGKIYVSAYAVPKENTEGNRGELSKILQYIHDSRIFPISSEELTPMMRENYSAVLLICDPDVGTPEAFYSVKGSIGGALSYTEDGNLRWNVNDITSSYYSPFTNAYTFLLYCTVFQYEFDNTGVLVNRIETENTTRISK